MPSSEVFLSSIKLRAAVVLSGVTSEAVRSKLGCKMSVSGVPGEFAEKGLAKLLGVLNVAAAAEALVTAGLWLEARLLLLQSRCRIAALAF